MDYPDPRFPTDPALDAPNLENWEEEEHEETQRVTLGAFEGGWDEEYPENQ